VRCREVKSHRNDVLAYSARGGGCAGPGLRSCSQFHVQRRLLLLLSLLHHRMYSIESGALPTMPIQCMPTQRIKQHTALNRLLRPGANTKVINKQASSYLHVL
jgi:hypothetical protein